MSNILLLDRNIDEAERISSYFEARSYAVIWPKTIADLLYHVVHRDFCLAILDVALSAEDDHRFLDALRKVKGVPILVLGSDTADAEERLNSLRAGAHAYLCRPYSMEECFAQAQALIQAYSPHMQTRKEENSSCKMTVAGRLRISPESRQAFLGEKEIMLTRKEFDLLLLFAENPNKVFRLLQYILHFAWEQYCRNPCRQRYPRIGISSDPNGTLGRSKHRVMGLQ